jgi:hypothetical protein
LFAWSNRNNFIAFHDPSKRASLAVFWHDFTHNFERAFVSRLLSHEGLTQDLAESFEWVDKSGGS